MIVLGISAYYHDSAAAIVCNGEITAAAQEERFSRIKHDASFPVQAITFCLQKAGVTLDDLDAVVFYDKPFLKFERLLDTYYRFAPKGLSSFINAMPVWLKEKLFLKRLLRQNLKKVADYDKKNLRLKFTEHHLAHAASAFFASPFEEAAILTIDGVGEWATASISIGKGNAITTLKELHFPHSLGLLYAAFTYFLGFKVNSGEYKLMGLAPYGIPESEAVLNYKSIILDQLIDLKPDGSLWLNQKYFTYTTGMKMLNEKQWATLFGFPKRPSESPIEQQHCNLALAIQQVTEAVVIKMVMEAKKITQIQNICLAGGVALNCVANGKIVRQNIFDHHFIQPAAGDAGGALGAALAGYHIYGQHPRLVSSGKDSMQHAFLGPEFDDIYIKSMAQKCKATFTEYENFDVLCQKISSELASDKVVGWFQGRMEFGPRALGNRSILANPASTQMQRVLNLKIKNRESFRPFAPAVLEEDLETFFELKTASPYMLLVSSVNEALRQPLPPDYQQLTLQKKLETTRSSIPAVTHVDFSARIQTVTQQSNPKFWQLLRQVKKQTGIGMLINTSFNVRDEPIVCTPEDAYHCFINTQMDFLVMNNFVFTKQKD